MPDYRLPGKVRDAIIRYLASRPWIEVHEGIESLQALEELPQARKTEGPPVEALGIVEESRK